MSALLVNAGAGETRIALVENGRLEDFQVARDSEVMLTGNLYLGRVTRVMPAMQAAFVEFGEARAGFLGLGEARHLASKPEPTISDCVREGEALAVEVIGEPQGEKGARLAARPSLPPELEARRRMARPPALLQAAPSLPERVLKDLPGTVVRIAIDDARAAQAARDWCRSNRPDLMEKIETVPQLFDDGLEEQIAELFAPRLALGNGGWITIEVTEGFTAIDVNSGGFAASGGRGETSLAVNLEAAQEIGRQVRLRGIGGLVVIDFIQMQDAASTRLVESVLGKSLGDDVTTDVTVSRTGLATVTRKRARPALARFLEVCACCKGRGCRPTPESIALALLRAAEAGARAAPGRKLTARAAPEVTAWLAAHESGLKPALARRGIIQLGLENTAGPREAFDVSTG